MTESPSELLTRAADRIRDLAAKAQRGPWVYDDDSDRVMVDDTVYSVTCYAGADHDDSQWIAALSPAVAPHLEAWLRHAAVMFEASKRRAETWHRVNDQAYVSDSDREALALARAVLGQGQP